MRPHLLRAVTGKAGNSALPADAGRVQPRAAPLSITRRHAAGGRAGELWAGLHLPGINPQKLQRSEEHTSELQSQSNLVCRLLLEKKKNRDLFTTDLLTKPLSQPHL